jgi:AcrR family transcriptional regulator
MLLLSTTNVALVYIAVLALVPVDKYHHGNLKDVLLKAAFRLVAKSGLDQFTLREVARRAGVSHNAPYRHFRHKEDLVAALAAEAFRQLSKRVREEMATGATPEGRLRAAAKAYLHYGLENPTRIQVMFHAPFDRQEYPEYVEAYREALAIVMELVQACGDQTEAEAEVTGELIWASVHGIMELGLSGRLQHGKREPLESLTIQAVDAMLRSRLKN